MRKGLILTTFFLILFNLSMSDTYAQNIITGNATAKSRVETTIEGGGNVSTNIEVSVNGKKKSLDASKSGTYILEVSSSDKESTSSSSPSANSYTPKPKTTNGKQAESIIGALERILNELLKSIDKLFSK